MGTTPTSISSVDVRVLRGGTAVYISCLANVGTNLGGKIFYGASSDALSSSTAEVVNGSYLRFGFYVPWASGGTMWYKISLYERDGNTGVMTDPASISVGAYSATTVNRDATTNNSAYLSSQALTPWTPTTLNRTATPIASPKSAASVVLGDFKPANYLPNKPTLISEGGVSDDLVTNNASISFIFSATDYNFTNNLHYQIEFTRTMPSLLTLTVNTPSPKGEGF